MTNEYRLEEVAWEITMGCNLRCIHCGSVCGEKLPGELSTEQALEMIDDLALLQPKTVVLTGGEPLTREDWPCLAARLSRHGIEVRLITNGTMVTLRTIEKMIAAGIRVVSVSVDGLCEQHNRMRQTDCYDRCLDALTMLGKNGITAMVNTTIIKDNLDSLSRLKRDLQNAGVVSWQLQMGLPCGRMSEHRELMIDAPDVTKIIDFAYTENLKGDYPKIFLADSIGYYSTKEILSRRMAYETSKYPLWMGCNAGITSLGIFHNGDVTGCLSIRDNRYVEGNVTGRSISDIWTDKRSFAWRRNLSAKDMTGSCRTCVYVEYCLGGCSNLRLCVYGDLYAQNDFCSFNVARKNQ